MDNFLKDKYISNIIHNCNKDKLIFVLKNRIIDSLPLCKDICEEIKKYALSYLILSAFNACSRITSWFEEYEESYSILVDKPINKIINGRKHIILPPSMMYNITTVYSIMYNDGMYFDFLLKTLFKVSSHRNLYPDQYPNLYPNQFPIEFKMFDSQEKLSIYLRTRTKEFIKLFE